MPLPAEIRRGALRLEAWRPIPRATLALVLAEVDGLALVVAEGVNVLDLFSCIGGHALGLHAAGGFRTVGFCEIDERRRAFIARRFPGIPVHDDVRTLTAAPGSAEVVIGGPPCQRTSVAAAVHGGRSGETLWPEMLRIGVELAAQWFVVEQPPGNKEWEAKVAHDLEGVGYHSARVEFAACDLGAPHIRRRVFILANPCLARLTLAWQAVPSEVERYARAAAAGNPWREGPPRGLRVAHGPSGWLDRNAAVEAIGDSNPPGMATVIGRAIMTAYRCELSQPNNGGTSKVDGGTEHG